MGIHERVPCFYQFCKGVIGWCVISDSSQGWYRFMSILSLINFYKVIKVVGLYQMLVFPL